MTLSQLVGAFFLFGVALSFTIWIAGNWQLRRYRRLRLVGVSTVGQVTSVKEVQPDVRGINFRVVTVAFDDLRDQTVHTRFGTYRPIKVGSSVPITFDRVKPKRALPDPDALLDPFQKIQKLFAWAIRVGFLILGILLIVRGSGEPF